MPISVAVIDDYRLFREALVELVQKFDGYEVLYVATNGQELLDQIQQCEKIPDLALVDLHMPVMDGFETTVQLRQLYPTVRVLIVSISDRKEDIAKAVRLGAHGYVVKDVSPDVMRRAMHQLMTGGYFFPKSIAKEDQPESAKSSQASGFNLTDQELVLLRFASSNMTYREIADKMDIPLSILEEHLSSVYGKLNVWTRVSMVLEAVRRGLIEL